jgi:hypothetical protein
MSYGIRLRDRITGETCVGEHHYLRGGTYAMCGTDEATLNVTYNYAPHFYRTIDSEKGIRAIYGLTGLESQPVLVAAISLLGHDTDPDYWKPTEGNARAALVDLLTLARAHPQGVWDGD